MWNGTNGRCVRPQMPTWRYRRAACARDFGGTGLCLSSLDKCFALVREAASRTIGQRHYDVQLMAGWALLQGKLVEMETGEGKTIAATLPASTVALAGYPVHVITVNDYLAQRDADEMGPLYRFVGSERRRRSPGHVQSRRGGRPMPSPSPIAPTRSSHSTIFATGSPWRTEAAGCTCLSKSCAGRAARDEELVLRGLYFGHGRRGGQYLRRRGAHTPDPVINVPVRLTRKRNANRRLSSRGGSLRERITSPTWLNGASR